MARTSVILLSSLSALLVLITAQAADIGYGSKPCEQGKEYTECGSACPPSCDNMSPICNAMCKPGCSCKKGTVENGHGKCVRKEDCCSGNMIYSDCGNDCGRVCPSPANPKQVCTKECSAGCFCKPGYVHVIGSKTCVLPRNCPKIAPHH